MIDILNELYFRFDTLIFDLQRDVFAALAASAATFLALLIGAALAVYFAMSAAKRAIDPLGIFWFVLRASLIYGLVAGGALWSTAAFPFFSLFGENVGTTIYNAMAEDPIPGTGGFAGVLERYFTMVTRTVDTLFERIDGASVGVNVAEVVGAMMMVATYLSALTLIALGFALVLIAKVTIAILLAVAPVFLVWMFTGATQGIAQGWLGGITRALALQIIVFAILGLVLASASGVETEIFERYGDDFSDSSDANDAILAKLGEVLFVTGFGNVLLLFSPVLASMVGGGAVQFGTSAVRIAGRSYRASPGIAAKSAIGGAMLGGMAYDALRGAMGAKASPGESIAETSEARDKAQKLTERLERTA